MLTTDNFETVYACPAEFFDTVDTFSLELTGVVKSFAAIEACGSEDMLDLKVYKDAIFGVRVALGMLAEKLESTLNATHKFPCVMVKENKR